MTREEALKKIEELQRFIEESESFIDDDKIFLLSKGEYEMYKDTIPLYNHYWWLRSPGNCDSCVAYIRRDGKIDHDGTDSDYIGGCIRPALRIIGSTYLEIGERFIKYDFPWIYLGDNLAIAEVPIANNRFDSNNNDYKNSEIRQFLKNWLEARK